MKYMGWSYDDLQTAPASLVRHLIAHIEKENRDIERARQRAKRKR